MEEGRRRRRGEREVVRSYLSTGLCCLFTLRHPIWTAEVSSQQLASFMIIILIITVIISTYNLSRSLRRIDIDPPWQLECGPGMPDLYVSSLSVYSVPTT